MAKLIHNTTSAAGGIWSPKLDARVDQAKYGTALRQCTNMIPYKSGGLTRAPGTQFIAPAKLANTIGHNYAVRLVPFIYSPATEFMLEFGHNYVRFYSNGAQVIVPSAATWVSGFYPAGSYATDSFDGLIYYRIPSGTYVSNISPHSLPSAWVQQTILEQPTPYNGDALTGSVFDTDVFQIYPCQINDVIYITHPNYPPCSLTRITDTNWVMKQVLFITPALLDQNANDTVLTPSAVTGYAVQLTATAPAWVSKNYYTLINSIEVTGVIYNCIVAHTSGTSFATDLASGYWEVSTVFRSTHIGSTWQLATLKSASYVEYNGTAAVGFSVGTSGVLQCKGAYTVRTEGVWSADIALQRSLDGGLTWVTINTITSRSDYNGTFTGTAVIMGLYRFSITNTAALVNAGATNPRVVFESVEAFVYGLIQITGYTNPYLVQGNIIAQMGDSNPMQAAWISGNAYTAGQKVSYNFINYTCAINVTSATPPSQDVANWTATLPGGTEYWSEAAWSDYRGYPRCVTAFQQRMVYASSGYEQQRFWGTVTNDIENFDRSDPSLATSGFAFDLFAPSRGPILWLIAQTDLFAGLSGAEWIINSGTVSSTGISAGGSITPTNISAGEQGSYGSAPFVMPKIVGNAVLFSQRQADAVRQMLFSVYTAKQMSQDLTVMADHIFASGVVQLGYQGRWHHQGILWVITRQGSLCGLTYDLDQEVFGWCQRMTGFGQVDSNGALITPDNGFESVASIDGQGSNDDEVWVVANRLIGGVQTRYIERVNPYNWEERFNGAPAAPAPNLGYAYYVDCGISVSNPGSLTISGLSHLNGRYVYGLADGVGFGPLLVTAGTATLPASIPTTVGLVQIGLPIPYVFQPMKIDSDPRAGNTQGLTKQISDVFIRVWNSMGGSISNGTVSSDTNYRQPVPIPYTNSQANPFAAPQLVTTPTDIRITPFTNPQIDTDPIIVVQGNDALPLTVLGYSLKYDLIATP